MAGKKGAAKARPDLRPHNLARRFAEHLIDIGATEPVALTEAQVTRAALLADFETYLVKQRGLSSRSIPHSVGFARRFLDHRFGEAMHDLGCLCGAAGRRCRAVEPMPQKWHRLRQRR